MQKRILMVDDNGDFMVLCKTFLEKYNSSFNVETCSSGFHALQLASEKSFDIVISDYQMPKMNGIEFLVHLRASGCKVPFILFTGYALHDMPPDALVHEAITSKALCLGCVYYILKSGYPECQYILARTILELLEQSRSIPTEKVKNN